MRLPGNLTSLTPSIGAAAVTSALTTATTLTAAHLIGMARLRLAERRAAAEHEAAHRHDEHDQVEFDEDDDQECDLDVGPYPDERLVLRDMDGASTGACIAALRERYLVEDGSAKEILDHFDYHELLRSFAETALVLAYDMAEANFMGCGCDNEDCENQEPDPEVHPMVAGKYLLFAAQSFESRHEQHVQYCEVCTVAGHRARGRVRAQFCRDIADDLITNMETDDLVLHGVPLQAAFDVVCSLLEILESMTEEPIVDKVNDLSKGLAFATGHAIGVPFGGHTH